MHWLIKLITAIFLTVISLILLFSAAFAYLIVTPLGGKILVRYFKQQFVSVGLIHIGHYEGSLHNGFILKDVYIRGLSYLPDALLRIQEIRVRLPLWDLSHSDFSIFNARAFIPDCDPVVFTGEVYAGQIKGNLYSNSVDIQEASRYWASADIKRNLQGFIANIDLKVQGSLSSVLVNGSFVADELRYKSILLTNVFSRVNLNLLPSNHQLQIKGEVILDSGLVNVRKINLQVLPSKFIFHGEVFNPTIDIQLGAKVEDMDFHLSITGSSDSPQLNISSDPPMSSQDALDVLFTGNFLGSSTTPFSGVTSSELAENFLDYSLQDINEAQDVGFKTKLTDNLKVGAEMDELPLQPGETNTYYSRKINGELDLTEHTSLNISQEVFPQDDYPPTSYQDTQPQAETQFYVQYKKRF